MDWLYITIEFIISAEVAVIVIVEFIEDGDPEASHWNTSGQALLEMSDNGASWRLTDKYYEDERQTVLKDGSGKLAVTLNYMDGTVDKSKNGGLTVSCSSSSFGGLSDTSGYLCGNLGSGDQAADTKKHFKDAAAKLKMSTTLYLVYNMLVTERVPQVNPTCEEASEVTSKCAIPAEAVKTCGSLLDAKSYAKCFVKNNIDPLEAYTRCVKWRCRKDVLSCRTLEDDLETCPGKLKNELRCGGGGGGGGGGRYT